MNKVILMGRLVRDPEGSKTSGENPLTVTRFSVAVDRRTKSTEGGTDFLNCVAFGAKGDFAEKYLTKGTKVVVIGRVQTDNYTNKKGEKVWSTNIVVEDIEFAESKRAAADNGVQVKNNDGFMELPENLDDEGLPF